MLTARGLCYTETEDSRKDVGKSEISVIEVKSDLMWMLFWESVSWWLVSLITSGAANAGQWHGTSWHWQESGGCVLFHPGDQMPLLLLHCMCLSYKVQFFWLNFLAAGRKSPVLGRKPALSRSAGSPRGPIAPPVAPGTGLSLPRAPSHLGMAVRPFSSLLVKKWDSMACTGAGLWEDFKY